MLLCMFVWLCRYVESVAHLVNFFVRPYSFGYVACENQALSAVVYLYDLSF